MVLEHNADRKVLQNANKPAMIRRMMELEMSVDWCVRQNHRFIAWPFFRNRLITFASIMVESV